MKSPGVGIGYRPRLSASLLHRPEHVDFVEVVAEACHAEERLDECAALADVWPVLVHGVKTSLGSADGIDDARARQLGKIARRLRAPIISEHVAFVRAGKREIGHLTELPLTREAVDVIARNVVAVRRHLPDVPLLLENVARGFVWPTAMNEMSEGAFHGEIAERTGCDLLLDLGNLYANALNAARDPRALLAEYPLERVGMLHVAGGRLEDGFYFDTHADPVPEPVFELAAEVLRRRPDLPVMLERDAHLDDPAAILLEVDRLRALRVASRGALAKLQAELARRLTTDAVTNEQAPIIRARGVLARKRSEEALALLPSLSGLLSIRDAAILGALDTRARASHLSAVVDAFRIVDAALASPTLKDAATRDRLALHARFGGTAERPSPRRIPWIGSLAARHLYG